MNALTAEGFWSLYREYLRSAGRGKWECYWRDREWTPIAIPPAQQICTQFGMFWNTELRLDVAGWQWHDPASKVAWDLRIAFEHENHSQRWPEEVGKPCHVVADLRVLIAFYEDRGRITQQLDDCLALFAHRVRRFLPSEWLFAFGPVAQIADADAPYMAYTLTSDWRPQQIAEDLPLIPRVDFA